MAVQCMRDPGRIPRVFSLPEERSLQVMCVHAYASVRVCVCVCQCDGEKRDSVLNPDTAACVVEITLQYWYKAGHWSRDR